MNVSWMKAHHFRMPDAPFGAIWGHIEWSVIAKNICTPPILTTETIRIEGWRSFKWFISTFGVSCLARRTHPFAVFPFSFHFWRRFRVEENKQNGMLKCRLHASPIENGSAISTSSDSEFYNLLRALENRKVSILWKWLIRSSQSFQLGAYIWRTAFAKS